MEFTHFDGRGRARMVDVSGKGDTVRTAVARGYVFMKPETLSMIKEGRIKKGDVLAVAQVAGIMAAKKTPEIIPMCHNITLAGVDMDFRIIDDRNAVAVEARVKCTGKTGVEMEALTAVSAACLTIYDMCKAVDRDMVIKNIQLIEKSGGTSGDFRREEEVPWEK
ncbi:cyclic pyranopterin monophosphate synthase MoaC [Thermosediminibacter litoriperuensis]|uniref:Cyclic pyranopterin monophosphate synthase n=1 Tax=Thermosediminibacter litoriperuensis TaxID=291989 RepID=A0A5S5ASP3_9FIRM|nr:cyclic pyranopterin monophosphate synthase MoaC [Thermosediminibacter litoriperuensis]TYP54239.1 cyclic pyranopterin phosphate synthase [Thermosediminibacter litoriperuensis]